MNQRLYLEGSVLVSNFYEVINVSGKWASRWPLKMACGQMHHVSWKTDLTKFIEKNGLLYRRLLPEVKIPILEYYVLKISDHCFSLYKSQNRIILRVVLCVLFIFNFAPTLALKVSIFILKSKAKILLWQILQFEFETDKKASFWLLWNSYFSDLFKEEGTF